MLVESVTTFIATAINLIAPTNFEPFTKGAEPISTNQILINMCIMLFGELVLADGLLFLLSRIERFNMKVDLAQVWAERSVDSFYLFAFICMTVPFVSCAIVINNMCVTSELRDDGTVSPRWMLTQCPPLPGSYDEVMGWGNSTWEDYFLE